MNQSCDVFGWSRRFCAKNLFTLIKITKSDGKALFSSFHEESIKVVYIDQNNTLSQTVSKENTPRMSTDKSMWGSNEPFHVNICAYENCFDWMNAEDRITVSPQLIVDDDL